MATNPTYEEAYMCLMKGLTKLDLCEAQIPSNLVLTGDHSFPLAMNKQGHVLMAASLYGRGRIVVLGHEDYLTSFPALVENAVTWLRGDGDGSESLSVGVHQNVCEVADILSKSSFQTEVVGAFKNHQELGVFVTDAYSVEEDQKALVTFMKDGGGVLIAGQAWKWAKAHPNKNTLLLFEGNKVSGVAGIYFTEHCGDVECLSVHPKIPSSWMAIVLGKDFEDDLQFLLEGVSEFEVPEGIVLSEVLIHGPLAFPIGTLGDGRAFLAGTYYGQGRVIVAGHEELLSQEKMAPFWTNALRWLDQGRQGVVGVIPAKAIPVLSRSGLTCKSSSFNNDLSVFVSKTYIDKQEKEIEEFVAEGGGLLVGGQAWYWHQVMSRQNLIKDFAGNKFLNKMGLSLLASTIGKGVYTAPTPSQPVKDTYHFRHILHRFANHVLNEGSLTDQETNGLKKLGKHCEIYLKMWAHDCFSYVQILSTLTDIITKTGMPKMSADSPVTTPKGHLLLRLGSAVYRASQNPDALLPHLIKDNPSLPVVYDQKIQIDVDTAGGVQWISTGLYLCPGMKTNVYVPGEIVNKKWMIQISCQVDHINKAKLWRAPRVSEQFLVDSEEILVSNLWGGLIYLIAPPKTQVGGIEVTVQKAVSAPYYKFGVTTVDQWSSLRLAPAPWAELEFDNVILTVPSNAILKLERPDTLAAVWNDIMKAVADLAAIPHKFRRKERIVTDVQISHGLMHAGYPIMAHTPAAEIMVSETTIRNKGMWGPVHELGHNQQRSCWEFPPNTTEATCNLWSVYVHEKVLGISREKAHPDMTLENRKRRTEKFIKGGRLLEDWTVWVALETYIQLQEMFDWDAFKKVFATYLKMSYFPRDKNGKMNLYAEVFSEVVEMNLSGFFKAWGWAINAATEEKLFRLPPWHDHPMAEQGIGV